MKHKSHIIALLLLLQMTFSNSTNLNAQNSGFIQPFFNSDSAYVTVNNDFGVAKKVANGEIVSLSAIPPIKVNLYQAYAQPFDTLITLSEMDTVQINHAFRRDELTIEDVHLNVATYNKLNANLVISTDSATKIYMNDEFLGKGFVKMKTDKQTANFTFRNPYHGNSQRRLDIQSNTINAVEEYLQPVRSSAVSLFLIPAVPQFLKHQYIKGGAITTFLLASGGVAMYYQSDYSSLKSQFTATQNRYSRAETRSSALRYGDKMDDLSTQINDASTYRNIGTAVLLSVITYSMIDALLSQPANGYREKNKLHLNLKNELYGDTNTSTIGVRYDF